jgi:hypothetical protein
MKSLVIAMVFAAAPGAGGDGFQKTRWGMSPAEVQRLYPSARASRPGSGPLEVSETIFAGERAHLEFAFGNGALSHVRVHFKGEGLDREQMVQRCLRFRELLAKKYGDPPNSVLRWKSEREQDQFALGGEWETPSTIISLTCERAGNVIATEMLYSDKRIAHREDNAALEDL